MRKLKNKGASDIRRYLINIYGVVQGVGFRPFIYNLAVKYKLKGWVKNTGSYVVIDVEGERKDIKNFLNCIVKNPPTLASIEKLETTYKKLKGYTSFKIEKSSEASEKIRFISADVGTCSKCREDIFNHNSPYYNYPFTNCTNCGPRYSIIKKLPYDRENTTMKEFKMCSSCREEYENPVSRRFHAQPTCCPNCGPKYRLTDASGREIESNSPIEEAKELLKKGYIIALKGIGGFHLVCDASNQRTVELLRKRKKRPHKPLAVMAKDLRAVKKICYVSEIEEKVISSPKRPIVLLEKKKNIHLPENIAPLNSRLGIILPYAPIHYLLFDSDIEYLIMTSGNISGMPIQYKNRDAYTHLSKAADYFLVHNRDINIPVEDSVVKVVMDREMVIRSGRGYSPFTVNAGVRSEILALGAEKKASFSLSCKGYGYLSQYLGELDDVDTYNNYRYAIENLTGILNINPKIIAHDIHPYYLSTQYAQNQDGYKIPVQHHHAHMVSCMAEHKLFSEVIGVVFDGTGMGTDECIWGGEFLVGSRRKFIRAAHLKSTYIQGGDNSIKEPWRTALSYLCSIGYNPVKYLKGIDREKLDLTRKVFERKINCYKSSSMGRFFDCIASLIGLRNKVTYEGQVAVELESIMADGINECYSYDILLCNGTFQINYERIIKGILKDLENEVSLSVISAKFHNTVFNFTVETICRIREKYNINQVVLSGGVFQNDYLLRNVYSKLNDYGFKVYYNKKIPINDNGISFGQLIIADTLMEE